MITSFDNQAQALPGFAFVFQQSEGRNEQLSGDALQLCNNPTLV